MEPNSRFQSDSTPATSDNWELWMAMSAGNARGLELHDIGVAPMCADDASRVSNLFADTVRDLPYYNPQAKDAALSRYEAARLSVQIDDDPQSVLVATFDRDIVGFCFSQIDDGLIWLTWFGVHRRHRRKGIATAILSAISGRARSANAHKIWCDCRTTNQISQIVLNRASFRPVCTFNRHWHDQDYIIWEKFVS